MLSWWPVFGSSEHPIATSHKTTWKAGVPFWNGVGYQGGHRNPKGPCTPRMPRLPALKYQGLISAGLIQGQEGFSIICYLATVGCRLLVVSCWLLIAGCSCCWWLWFWWLFLVVAKWQVVAVARPRATFWGIFWYIQTFNATNTPGRRLKGHIWHPSAYEVGRKTKHHVVKFQISLRSLRKKNMWNDIRGCIYIYTLHGHSHGRCFLHDSLVHVLLQGTRGWYY